MFAPWSTCKGMKPFKLLFTTFLLPSSTNERCRGEFLLARVLSPAVTFWTLNGWKPPGSEWLGFSRFKKQTQMFVSVKANLWLYAIQHKSFRVRERCPGCNLNGFCTYFSHYQITFLIWFLFGLLCPCIPCLALLSPSFFLLLP